MDTTFVDGDVSQANRIVAAWLNDVNNLRYGANSIARGGALLQFMQLGTSSTVRDQQSKSQDSVSLYDFLTPAQIANCRARTPTDLAVEIQAAIDSIAARGGGTLLFPLGAYLSTVSIEMKDGVNVAGEGWGSKITFNGCHGFSYNYFVDFGNSRITNLYIVGTNTTTKYGIYQPGTNNSADELYGLSFDNNLITGFNVAIKLRTARNVRIYSNWIQEVNSGIELIGKCLVTYIYDNWIVKSIGSGAGVANGILADGFNYPVGGLTRPENVSVRDNLIYGFDSAVYANFALYVNILNNDIAAVIYGVEYTTVTTVLNIKNNHVEVFDAAALAAIIGHGLSATIDQKVSIATNHCIHSGAAAATCTGIQVNDALNANQTNTDIVGNNLAGFGSYDIVGYVASKLNIERNRCTSTGAAVSIFLQNAVGAVYVDKNECVGTISVDGSSAIATGKVTLGHNTTSDTFVPYANTWTPVLTFDTPGDLNVVYSTQVGRFRRWGDVVVADFAIGTSTFTHTTAAGSVKITGLPFASPNDGSIVTGSLICRGITKANYTHFQTLISANTQIVRVYASGSAQVDAAIATGDMPTGGTVVLYGTITYVATATL